jgi:hypothetical protein
MEDGRCPRKKRTAGEQDSKTRSKEEFYLMKLKVHPGKRYLTAEDGAPFFYLADTAWELFHRITREEAEYYFSVRAQQGFNVIQAVALAEFDGLTVPNAYGRVPLLQKDGKYSPEAPDLDGPYSYWDHVDACIRLAADKGLFVALLPTWGDKFNDKWGVGPIVFTPENAYAYGKWIGERYRDQWNIIWMLGGDRPLENDTHRGVIDGMGRGIREADPNHLITFHTWGDHASSEYVGAKDYIDFHTAQSGHGINCYESWRLMRRMREAEEKPFMDSEPRYEDHPACFNKDLGYLWNADDVRQNTYWNLMEGVCGNTYGNHNIWSFNKKREPYFPYLWHEVLCHPGAAEAQYAKALRLSRPYFEFRSAPELVEDDPAAMAHQSAGRGEKYAYIYTPLGRPVRAYLDRLAPGGNAVKASWFNPRTGEEALFAVVPAAEVVFAPPTSGKGCDWVLVLDVEG